MHQGPQFIFLYLMFHNIKIILMLHLHHRYLNSYIDQYLTETRLYYFTMVLQKIGNSFSRASFHLININSSSDSGDPRSSIARASSNGTGRL